MLLFTLHWLWIVFTYYYVLPTPRHYHTSRSHHTLPHTLLPSTPHTHPLLLVYSGYSFVVGLFGLPNLVPGYLLPPVTVVALDPVGIRGSIQFYLITCYPYVLLYTNIWRFAVVPFPFQRRLPDLLHTLPTGRRKRRGEKEERKEERSIVFWYLCHSFIYFIYSGCYNITPLWWLLYYCCCICCALCLAAFVILLLSHCWH